MFVNLWACSFVGWTCKIQERREERCKGIDQCVRKGAERESECCAVLCYVMLYVLCYALSCRI